MMRSRTISRAQAAGDLGPRLGALDAASFGADGDTALLRATAEGAHVGLIAGRPLRERAVSYGPFVMNSEEQIAAAIERYRSGRMGRLAPANNT
jgi:redox-sensitive bicupin YhaK (pirin superfamily)